MIILDIRKTDSLSGWTARIFALDLSRDLKCGAQVVSTIQAFLDTRASALPRIARQRRGAREAHVESQDDFSFDIDFSAVDLAALGGDVNAEDDPVEVQDKGFAGVSDLCTAKLH